MGSCKDVRDAEPPTRWEAKLAPRLLIRGLVQHADLCRWLTGSPSCDHIGCADERVAQEVLCIRRIVEPTKKVGCREGLTG